MLHDFLDASYKFVIDHQISILIAASISSFISISVITYFFTSYIWLKIKLHRRYPRFGPYASADSFSYSDYREAISSNDGDDLLDDEFSTAAEQDEEINVDPITLLGATAAIITIIDAIERTQGSQYITLQRVTSQYREREKTGDAPSIDDNDLSISAEYLIELRSVDRVFVDRINDYCLKKLEGKSRATDADFEDANNVARLCVCTTIHQARKMNGGKIPEHLRKMFEDFQCATIL